MATLTTLDHVQYYFDPAGIVAISDRDPSTGTSVTSVYGLNTNYLNIGESVQELMARLNITEKFGRLTRADGASIWINASSVLSIRSRIWSDTPASNSVVVVSALTPITQWVTESFADVAAILHVLGT